MIKRKPFKIGYSKGIILPSTFCEQLGIEIGKPMEISLIGDHIEIKPISGDSHES